MFRIRDLEDEILNLKKQLETEKANNADLELFKNQKLQELKQTAESTFQATKAKFLDEIELLKKEKRDLQAALDAKDKEDIGSRSKGVSKFVEEENKQLREKLKKEELNTTRQRLKETSSLLVGKERECSVLSDELKSIRETFDAQKISPNTFRADERADFMELYQTINALKQDLQDQQRTSTSPSVQQTAKVLQEKITALKQDLEKETKFRLELQEKLNALEGTHKKLKEQLQNAQMNATTAAYAARELDKKSLVEQKGANITTIETIVKMEKDMKLLKDELEQKKKKIDDMMEQETESRRQRNLLNQFVDEHSQKNVRLVKTIEELNQKLDEEVDRRIGVEEQYSKQAKDIQVKLEGERQRYKELEDSIAKIRQGDVSQQQNLQLELADYKSRLQNSQLDLNALKEALERTTKQKEAAEDEKKQMEDQRKKEAEARLRELHESSRDVEARLFEQKQRVVELEFKLKQEENNRNNVESQKNEEEKKKKELMDDVRALETKVSEWESHFIEAQETIKELEFKLKAEEQRRVEMESSFSNSQLKKDMEHQAKEQATLSAHQGKLEAELQAKAKLEAKLEEYRSQLGDRNKLVENSKTEENRLKLEIRELKEKLTFKEDEILQIKNQLESRTAQQRQFLEVHNAEVDMFKKQLETKKQQARQFLEKKQQDFLAELAELKAKNKETIAALEEQLRASEEQWLSKNLETEKSKYQLSEHTERMNKELLSARGEADSLRQLLSQADEHLQNVKESLSREIINTQAELSLARDDKLQLESQIEQQKQRSGYLEEEIEKKNDESRVWKEKYLESSKLVEQLLHENNAKHIDIVSKAKQIEDADKNISQLKLRIKEYQIKSFKSDFSWEEKKKLEENILKEWRRKIQFDIEMNVYRMLEEKLKQFEELLVATAPDSESREKLGFVMASLLEFWNKEKLRLQLEFRLNGLKDNLQQQKVRIDSEVQSVSKKSEDKPSIEETPEVEIPNQLMTESLLQINLLNTREYVGNTISMAASFTASKHIPSFEPLTESQLSPSNIDTLKTNIETELFETLGGVGVPQLKTELLHLKTKLEELLVIIDSNSM